VGALLAGAGADARGLRGRGACRPPRGPRARGGR
jgi:hypothetical protein